MTNAQIPKPLVVTLNFAKSTIGTHVYQEDMTKPRATKTFPTIYIQKHMVSDPPPARIRITVEEF